MKIIYTLFLIALSSVVVAQNLVIQNVHLIDVEAKKILKDQSILIENGTISAIGKRKKIKAPKETPTIDGTGKYLIPGLIDSHIHLFQSGGLYTRPDAVDLRAYRPYEEERLWLINQTENLLQRYLACGITSVIDIGGPMYQFQLREQLSQNAYVPNIFMTGPLISTFQPPELDVEDAPIIKVSSSEEAIALVQKQVPLQPDFIKIWYITLPTQTAESTYAIVKATIDESHKNGLRVAVHATELNTAKLALKAGADVLVHSVDDPIDEDFVQLLKTNNAVYIPTLMVHGKYFEVLSQNNTWTKEDFEIAHPIQMGTLTDMKHLPDTTLFKQYQQYITSQMPLFHQQDSTRKANLKQLWDLGIPIATGTDAGNIGTMHAASFYQEIGQMQEAGLSNWDILQASTIKAAQVVAKEAILGSIAEGKIADMVLLNANPIDDLEALKDIHSIIKKGLPIDGGTLPIVSPADLAQQQLNGYNARNIDAFMQPYSDSVRVYEFPNKLLLEGKENMRAQYKTFFDSTPDLHCQLVNRIVQGNTVIDQEIVTGFPNGFTLNAVAVYKIANGKIQEMYFIE